MTVIRRYRFGNRRATRPSCSKMDSSGVGSRPLFSMTVTCFLSGSSRGEPHPGICNAKHCALKGAPVSSLKVAGGIRKNGKVKKKMECALNDAAVSLLKGAGVIRKNGNVNKKMQRALKDAAASFKVAVVITKNGEAKKKKKNPRKKKTKVKALGANEPFRPTTFKAQRQDAIKLRLSGKQRKAGRALRAPLQNSFPGSFHMGIVQPMDARSSNGEADSPKTGNSILFRSNGTACPAFNLLMDRAQAVPQAHSTGYAHGVTLKQEHRIRA
jgi:hypothetical protein